MDEEAANAARREKTMNEKKTKGLLAAAMSTAMFVSSTAGAVPILANETAEPQAQAEATPELVPQPQSVTYAGGTLEVSDSVNVEGTDQADADAVTDLKDFLEENGIAVNETSVEGDTTFILGEADDSISALDSAKEALGMDGAESLGEEGYVLKVDAASDTVVIEGKDGDGTFYGVQTLRQLDMADEGMSLAEADVSDAPTMATRGTIEGFYGNPWTHADRLSQIEFYGDYKMNTYIYAPKDDPYHREQWREPYPDSEMDRMQELIDTAKENKVDFVFALSPGIDIQFGGDAGEADYQALVDKCQSLYDMGVRSFAIFFDDISNKDGVAQASLLNRFNEEFVQEKGDVKPLITVPTEYDSNAMGSGDRMSQYTQDFSATIDDSIIVLWTGSAVVTEGISVDNAQTVKSIYGDNVGIWWNYPCTDYIQDKLGLGPIYGLDKGLADELDFLVMNPMEHAELSKITLATGADYSWNTAAYDYDDSFRKSIDLLYGDLAPYMYTFANHSSRLVAGWASTGRADAPEVRELMDTMMKKVAQGSDASAEITALETEFDNMILAADTLKAQLPEEELSHCSGNLDKLKSLGEYDKIALQLFLAKNEDEPDQDTVDSLTAQLNSALRTLQSGKLVSEQTAVAFIQDVIDYNVQPEAGFDVSSTFIAPGESVTFTSTCSLSATDLHWTFKGADVETSTEEDPTVTYSKEGVYTVQLVASNKRGEDTVVKEGIITVSADAAKEQVNLALNKSASASGYTASSESPDKALDGIINTKWCTTNYGSQWLRVDLGEVKTIAQIVVSHAEMGGEGSSLNTAAFHVEVSTDGSSYTEILRVNGNTASQTVNAVPVTLGRYVRLVIDEPTQGGDSAARIYEFEVHGLDEAITMPPEYVETADKTALNEAITNAQALSEEEYTANSWSAVAAALQSAQEVAADDTANQSAVDDAANALNNAVSALQAKASQAAMDALKAVVADANALQDDYSETDFAAVQSAIDAAQALLDDPNNASSTAVVSAMIELSQAISALPEEGASDKLRENLKDTIDYINAHILTNVDGVRPGKVNELKTAVAEAYQVYINEDATADEIKGAIRTLSEKAQELWQIVSKAELNALIDAAEAIEADGYTEITYRALQAAITAAQSVAANDDATMAEVTTAITDLASAMAGLEQITLDTSALEHEIELAEQIVANIDDYVPSTVEGLADKLDAAKAALDATSQDAIDEATKSLREARLNARTKADVSALEALIAKVNAMDLRAYTSASQSAVRSALQNAEAAVNDAEVTQEEVNAAMDALNTAVDGLVKAEQPAVSEPSVNTPEAGSTTNTKPASTAAGSGIGALFAALASSAGAAGFLHRRKNRK